MVLAVPLQAQQCDSCIGRLCMLCQGYGTCQQYSNPQKAYRGGLKDAHSPLLAPQAYAE